jgi:DNA-binding transcriptional ArsR family regulator
LSVEEPRGALAASSESGFFGRASPGWSARELERTAELFFALAHEGRLQILLCLSETAGMTVSELLRQVGGQQSALSHQLRLLKERRLVKSHRRGRNVIYTLYDRHVSQVIADTLEHVREEA